MKKSKVLAGLLIFLGVGCLVFGISRYFEDTKVQQPAVLQEGVEDLGTGMIQTEESDVVSEEASDDKDSTQTKPFADKGGDRSEEN